MHKTTLLLVSSVFAASAFGLPALADKGPHMFERADANGDGFVSKQEFAATRDTMFQTIDANKDGILSQDELQKARETWRQKMGKAAPDQSQMQPGIQAQAQNDQPGQQPGKERHGFMRRADTNQDGQISTAEFAAAGDKMFARLDDNGDGKIAKDEVPHHRKRLPEQQPVQ